MVVTVYQFLYRVPHAQPLNFFLYYTIASIIRSCYSKKYTHMLIIIDGLSRHSDKPGSSRSIQCGFRDIPTYMRIYTSNGTCMWSMRMLSVVSSVCMIALCYFASMKERYRKCFGFHHHQCQVQRILSVCTLSVQLDT